MISTHTARTPTLAAAAVLLLGACSGGQDPRHITAREVAIRLDVSELTPKELKRLEQVINAEVSPCGDDVTLAESLFNPEHCPLAPLAGHFVVEMLKDDYNAQEIGEAYVVRYASIKGLEISEDGSPRSGAKKPLVTLVVFTDFECPFCAKAAERIHELVRQHPDELAVVHKNYPLDSHPMAETAARAAYAAWRQDKFWEMHDTIFSAIGSPLTRERLDLMALGLGLDTEQFAEDLASPGATAAISADRQLGEQLGVDGTPSIFINGRLLDEGLSGLDARLAEELLRHEVLSK